MEVPGSGGVGADSGRGGGVRNGEMPGRVMEQQGAIGSQDLKRDRSHAQQGASQGQAPAVQQQPVPRENGLVSNGANGVLPNGVPAPGESFPTTNGESRAARMWR